jgi:putative Holliday junction resolvase
MKRVLAIDYGTKLIGLALSDESQTFAFSHSTLSNKSLDFVCESINKIIKQKDIETVVIGLPQHLDGEESAFMKKVQEFGKNLYTYTQVAIQYVDERYTTEHAKQEYSRMVNKKINKDFLQSESARLILEKYLEKKRGKNLTH